MISRTSLLRPFGRATQPSSALALRRNLQQRFAHQRWPELKGAGDNEFNRNRAAVRAHAAASADLWRKLSIYICIPAITISLANGWVLYKEHWEHWETLPPLEDRVEYSYQNIRTKKFPWGDGDKTLFWNPKVNYHKLDK